ncbi:hypothetical protein ADUPG1_008570 [Aduncisulcus paluster]|uniref:Uncharacterized protein n=1 Tax=Aduncisulcus paluster TaxID=2918883 RepID=A0ABQ5KTP1_9EUKA|nr:hypothetical protein ADUPG1_008570 [Aduncisulcus paluster]
MQTTHSTVIEEEIFDCDRYSSKHVLKYDSFPSEKPKSRSQSSKPDSSNGNCQCDSIKIGHISESIMSPITDLPILQNPQEIYVMIHESLHIKDLSSVKSMLISILYSDSDIQKTAEKHKIISHKKKRLHFRKIQFVPDFNNHLVFIKFSSLSSRDFFKDFIMKHVPFISRIFYLLDIGTTNPSRMTSVSTPHFRTKTPDDAFIMSKIIPKIAPHRTTEKEYEEKIRLKFQELEEMKSKSQEIDSRILFLKESIQELDKVLLE